MGKDRVTKATTTNRATDQPKLMISTRLQKSLIANLKAIAKIRGVKYQALIRQVLTEYIAETKPELSDDALKLAQEWKDRADDCGRLSRAVLANK